MDRRLIFLWVSLGCATLPSQASGEQISDIRVAIDSGRLDQARSMIAEQVKVRGSTLGLEEVLADLSFASGNNVDALSQYQVLLRGKPDDRGICERAGMAALRLNRIADAEPLVACATAGGGGTWRAWNASGVLADLKQDWAGAERSYSIALRLAGENAAVLNNVGYSYLLQGDWARSATYFERAYSRDSSIERIGNNLELARTALAESLPARMSKESPSAWAARLNDAGVAAALTGDRLRAIAGFTRALEASGTWYARAANNLEALSLR